MFVQCMSLCTVMWVLISICMFCQGALVPLSDEVLEHLQMEGCNILAERLALSSGASVKMINGRFLYLQFTCMYTSSTVCKPNPLRKVK